MGKSSLLAFNPLDQNCFFLKKICWNKGIADYLDHIAVKFIFLFDRPFNKDFLFAENVKGAWMGPPTEVLP